MPPAVEQQFRAELAAIDAGPAREAGLAAGEAAAAAILERRRGDDLQAALTKPYTVPAPDSAAYTADYHEVQALGVATGSTRSAEQTGTGDPAWTPLCVTPPFPEYNSTHAAAAARVLALTIGDLRDFEIRSADGTRRSYRRFGAAAMEEGQSRVARVRPSSGVPRLADRPRAGHHAAWSRPSKASRPPRSHWPMRRRPQRRLRNPKRRQRSRLRIRSASSRRMPGTTGR